MFPDDDDGIRYGVTLGEELAHRKRKKLLIEFLRLLGLFAVVALMLFLFLRVVIIPGLVGSYGARTVIPFSFHLPWGT